MTASILTRSLSGFRAGASRWLQALPWRVILAGPMALVLAVLAMAGLPALLPVGAGGVNHVVFPVLGFPLIWAALAVVPVVADRLARCGWAYLAGLLAMGVLIACSLLG